LTSPALCFFNWPSPCGWPGETTAALSDKFCTLFSFRIQQLWFVYPASDSSATSWRNRNENRAGVQGVLPDHY
jgi:hypothetical protein